MYSVLDHRFHANVSCQRSVRIGDSTCFSCHHPPRSTAAPRYRIFFGQTNSVEQQGVAGPTGARSAQLRLCPRFAALAARAFARFATSAAFRAGDIFLFAGALLAAGFAALTASQRFFVAATIAALPARLSFRFFLGAASCADGSVVFFDAAHLFRCASAIAFLPAALIFRRLGVAGSAVAAGSVGPPVSQPRSSTILASSFSFWASIPRIAAVTISVVSFGVGMLLDLPRFFHRKGDAEIHTTLTGTLGGRLAYTISVQSKPFRRGMIRETRW